MEVTEEALARALVVANGGDPDSTLETTEGTVSVLDQTDEWWDTPRTLARDIIAALNEGA